MLETLNGVHTALLNSDESNAQQESMIVAQAGMLGRITVATNMAGRGTDILLGGDPAQLSLLLLAQPYSQHFIAAYAAGGGGLETGSSESNAAQKLQVGARLSCRDRIMCFYLCVRWSRLHVDWLL